jgi:hypothetical protein
MATTQKELDDIGVELGLLEHTLSTLVSAAQLDGTIDNEEQDAIDDMEQCIRAAKRKRDELKAELAGNAGNGAAGSSNGSSAAPASASPNYTLARIVPGRGGYVYAQWPDGELVIMQGPNGKKDLPVKRGTAAWEAITKELGTFGGTNASSSSPPAAEQESGAAPKQSDSSVVAAIAEKQIALQMELLNASPDEAKAIIEQLEAANVEMAEVNARLAGSSGNSSTPTEPLADTETLGESLLVLHADLYQEFLNAGDPLNPDLLTAGQLQILEEMRTISPLLAIEAERSILTNKHPELDGLEGADLKGALEQIRVEDMSDYGEGVSDEEFAAGESADATSQYDDLDTEGQMDVEDIIWAAESEHNRLMNINALDQSFIDERIEQIRRKNDIPADVKIEVTWKDDKIVGFHYDGESDLGREYGIIYLDLNGQKIDRKYSTTSVEGEILVAGAEIAASLIAQPVEMVIDIKDLYEATVEYSQADDGSIVPLIITAGAVVIPYTRIGKKVFDVAGTLVEAGRLARVVEGRVTPEALKGIGIIDKKSDVLDDTVRNAQGPSAEAIEAALDAIRREMDDPTVDKAASFDKFIQRNDVTSILLRLKDEGLTLDDIGVRRQDLSDLIGGGSQEELDDAARYLSDKLNDKLDDRAFDEMQTPGDLPDNWQDDFQPDVHKVYDDTLPQAEMGKIEDEVLQKLGEQLGIKGSPEEIRTTIKYLSSMLSQGFQKKFKKDWEDAVKASKAAAEKMEWVKKYVKQMEELQRRIDIDPTTDQAKKDMARITELALEAHKIAREAFDNVRDAFWRRVNKRSKDYLKAAGLKVGSGDTAPTLQSTGQAITIEHKNRLQDDPLRAIDADNMTFSFMYENTTLLEQRRKLIKERFDQLGYEGKHDWL